MTNPQSPATLADEFEAFVTSDDEYGDAEFGQFCQERRAAILTALRRSDAGGEYARGRAEALREAAAITLDQAIVIGAKEGSSIYSALALASNAILTLFATKEETNG